MVEPTLLDRNKYKQSGKLYKIGRYVYMFGLYFDRTGGTTNTGHNAFTYNSLPFSSQYSGMQIMVV